MVLRLVSGASGSPAERRSIEDTRPASRGTSALRTPLFELDDPDVEARPSYSLPPPSTVRAPWSSPRGASVPPPSSGCPGVRRVRTVRSVAPATTWEAKNQAGETVALFELLAHALPGSRRRFLQDAGAFARVTREAPNPGLLRVHALAPDGASFVADLWDNGTLRELVHRRCSFEKKLGLVRRICAALTAAHAQCVYFGRLRPDSIVLDDDGCPVIAELGASADAAREQGKVYVAPEARLSGAADARADVYAAGRLIHFLLLERDPEEAVELLPALDELCEFPAGLVRIVRRCLSSDPGTRYRSAASLAADLGRYTEADRVGLGHPHGKERRVPRTSTPPAAAATSNPPPSRSGVRAVEPFSEAAAVSVQRQPRSKSSGVFAKVAGGTRAMLEMVGVMRGSEPSAVSQREISG